VSRTSMSDVLPGLIVLATGGSMAPPLLLLTILFLDSRRPIPSATALALGYFTTCALLLASGASCTLPTLTRNHPDGWSR
jgi:hypothetical protein